MEEIYFKINVQFILAEYESCYDNEFQAWYIREKCTAIQKSIFYVYDDYITVAAWIHLHMTVVIM